MNTLVEMTGARLQLHEEFGEVEIPFNHFTLHRLDKTYPFITSRFSGLAQELGHPLDILDVGTHNGIMAKYFVDQPEDVVRSVTAVEISKKRVEEVKKQPFLQKDIRTGRYRVLQEDGTNMKKIPAREFDLSNHTEVLVDLVGNAEDMIKEDNRVLRPNGMAIYTFPNANFYYHDQRGAFNIGQAWELHEFESMVKDSYDGDIRIAWFGQLPMTGEKRNEGIIAVNHHTKTFRFDEKALDIFPIFNFEGDLISEPYFYIACVRKFA